MVTLNVFQNNKAKFSLSPTKPKKARVKRNKNITDIMSQFTMKKQTKIQQLDKIMKKVYSIIKIF